MKYSKMKICLPLALVLPILLSWFSYEKYLAPATVLIINGTDESLYNVSAIYPGGRKDIPVLKKNEKERFKLHGIVTESGLFLEVGSTSLGATGYVGPYPSYTEIEIIKENGKFKIKQPPVSG